jgi:cyclopropane fatty-acyl-phospholipid synthase-like methyltransferase
VAETNDWKEFFDAHAPHYLENVFTKNTLEEVAFLIRALHLSGGERILDMGCGTGRHVVELARRGYRVTGVDLSSGMLVEAQKAARAAAVEVEWIQADATAFAAPERFDAAICLCEGAFGLLGPDDDPLGHDLAILENIHASLMPGGRFLLTALNGYRFIRQFNDEDIAQGNFDALSMVEISTIEVQTPDGLITMKSRERGHLPTELRRLFAQTGFDIEHMGGGTAGNWGIRPLELDEMELMVIAVKTS